MPRDSHPTPTGFSVEKIEFPSDRISLGHLRRKYPRTFRFTWEHREINLTDLLSPLIRAEQEMAAIAYCNKSGDPISQFSAKSDQDELVELLSGDYIQLGLATGPHEAAELVRSIERQARKQVISR